MRYSYCDKTIDEMRTNIEAREATKRRQQKDAEVLKKEQNQMLELFTSSALQKVIQDPKGLITDFEGFPLKRKDHLPTEEPKPVDVGFKFVEPNLNFETAKYILKKQFHKQKTEEALADYDAKKRLEKKKEKAPSYLGGANKLNGDNKEGSLADKAARKIREVRQNAPRVSITQTIKGKTDLPKAFLRRQLSMRCSRPRSTRIWMS
jgi:hypothetical protein